MNERDIGFWLIIRRSPTFSDPEYLSFVGQLALQLLPDAFPMAEAPFGELALGGLPCLLHRA